MDGENNGKPYEQMDDLGVFPYFWKHPCGEVWNLVKKQAEALDTGASLVEPRVV